MDTQTIKYLGYENDWYRNPPQEIVKCKEKGHIPHRESTKYCVHTYTCQDCGIQWKMDSGD